MSRYPPFLASSRHSSSSSLCTSSPTNRTCRRPPLPVILNDAEPTEPPRRADSATGASLGGDEPPTRARPPCAG